VLSGSLEREPACTLLSTCVRPLDALLDLVGKASNCLSCYPSQASGHPAGAGTPGWTKLGQIDWAAPAVEPGPAGRRRHRRRHFPLAVDLAPARASTP
jgi:hypothetical protein